MEDESPTKYCSNCKKDIAFNNFSMHELHCKRHIVLCDYCEEPVPRSDMDEHLEEYHGDTKCDWCHLNMERYLLEQHKEKECPEREIHCKYCDLKVKVTLFREHEATCGSRTDECDMCKKRVMLRYMEDHMQNDCISKPRPQRKLINRYKPTAFDGKHTVGANHSNQRNLPAASNRRQPDVIASPPSRVGEYSPEDEGDDMATVQPNTQVPYIHPPTSLVRSDGPVLKPERLVPEQDRPISKPDISDRPISKHEKPARRPVTVPERPVPMPERPVPMPERPVPMPERPVPMPDEPVSTHNDYSGKSNSTVVIDQGWVGSVANAVKDGKELDMMIASSMYQEELRKSETTYTPPIKPQDDVHPNPASVSDEELALRLQREYDQQRERSYHDAHLAKRLQGDTPIANTSVVDSVLNNPSHAHQLYDQLEEFSKEDSLLARQLQEEERFTKGEDDGGLNTMMIYNRALIHEREEEERQKRVERDRELASRLQQQEEEQQQEMVNPPVHNHYQAEDVPQYHYQSKPMVVPQPNTLTLDAYEGDDDEDIRERGVYQDFKRDDTPTSPPAASHGIPCELCGAVIDFEQYQQHLEMNHPQFSGYVGRFQSHDTLYRPPSRPIDSPPPPRYPNHTPYSVAEPDDQVECQYCGDKFSSRISEFHAVACSRNPDKHLKDVYGNPPIVDEVVTSTITANEDDVQDDKATPTIPCEFCRKDVPVLEYEVHSGQCQRAYFARFPQYNTPLEDEYKDEDGIPCSKCSKLIPPSNIHIHEVQCKGGTPEKMPAAPILYGSGTVYSSGTLQDNAPLNGTPSVIQPVIQPVTQPVTQRVIQLSAVPVSRQPANTMATIQQQTTAAVLVSSDSEEEEERELEGEGSGGVLSNGPVSDLNYSSSDVLYCKYCGKPFMVSELDRHQRGCDKQKQRSLFPSNVGVATNSLPTVNSSKPKDHHVLLPSTASVKQLNRHSSPTYDETKSREKQHARLITTVPGILDTRQRMKLTSKPLSTSTTIRNTSSSKTAGSVPHGGMRDLSIRGRPLDGQGRRQDGLYAGDYNRNKSYNRKNSGDYGDNNDDNGTTGSSRTRPQMRRPKGTSQF